jgi:hypothetical protein
MRKTLTALAVILAVFVLAAPSAMAGEGRGSGNYFKYFYQWLRDDDGDGIPNCLDPDYVRPEDGSGYGKLGPGSGTGTGSCDGTPDRIRTRTRDQERDGARNGESYEYLHRYQRLGR